MPRQLHLVASEWPELAKAAGAPRSSAEEEFALQLAPFRGFMVCRQYLFAESIGRRWRFDFALREYLLAVEIEGVCVRRLAGELAVTGRHGTISGIRGDLEKYNTAALLGWTVLRFLQTDVRPRRAIEMTLRVLSARGWKQPGERT
ncbi:MAG: hypothetical protein ACRETH_01625 [Steroidobacteraceae bacterium]